MKNREEQIKKTFISLLETKNIEEIDVNLMCDSLNISRQSFYYHFKNIYDLICSFFNNDDIKCLDSSNYKSVVSGLTNYLYENREFYLEILKSSAKDILEEFCFSYLYRNFMEYLDKYDLLLDGKKDIARFLSKSISYEALYYYIKEDYTKSEVEKKVYSLINEETIDFIINQYKRRD